MTFLKELILIKEVYQKSDKSLLVFSTYMVYPLTACLQRLSRRINDI